MYTTITYVPRLKNEGKGALRTKVSYRKWECQERDVGNGGDASEEGEMMSLMSINRHEQCPCVPNRITLLPVIKNSAMGPSCSPWGKHRGLPGCSRRRPATTHRAPPQILSSAPGSAYRIHDASCPGCVPQNVDTHLCPGRRLGLVHCVVENIVIWNVGLQQRGMKFKKMWECPSRTSS